MESFLFVGSSITSYGSQVYCEQSASFFVDSDWLSFWNLNVKPSSQIINNQTTIATIEDGIRFWNPLGHIGLQSEEWSEKIQIIGELRDKPDWSRARLSDCGKYVFFPFHEHKNFANTGVINLDTGEIENLNQLTLPTSGDIRIIHVSKYAVFIVQNNTIYFNCQGSIKWHPITGKGTSRTDIIDLNSVHEFRKYKFYSVEYGVLWSILVECDTINGPIIVTKNIVSNLSAHAKTLGKTLSSGFTASMSQQGEIIIHYGDGDGWKYNHNFMIFSDDKLSYECKIDDISNEWDVYGFHRLGKLHVLANEYTYQVLNFSNEAVEIIHQGSNLYEHPNSEYLFFDYWGVVNNLLVSLLSELKKDEFVLTEDCLDFSTFVPNIINAISDNQNDIIHVYCEILECLIALMKRNPACIEEISYHDDTEILYYDGKEYKSSLQILSEISREDRLAERVLNLLTTISMIFNPTNSSADTSNDKQIDLFGVFDARFGHDKEIQEYFDWPSTEIEPSWYGLSSLDPSEWPKVGVLKRMGYSVGEKDGVHDHNKRCRILDYIFLSSKLPFVHSYERMLEWGPAASSFRLKKMAVSIATFGRNMRRQGHDLPLERYERDLSYLKQEYYDKGFSKGNWNWPSTSI